MSGFIQSLVCLIACFAILPAAHAGTPITSRVSVDSSGNQGNGDSQYTIATSNDGRYVAFVSSADNLVSDDTNGVSDIFVRDRQTGETSRVSVDSSGQQGNGDSSFPSLSGDGRHVAFVSLATNLVADDSNEVSDIFVHDLDSGKTSRVSVNSSGQQSDGGSLCPSFSGDGRYVAFDSMASNLVSGDTNGESDIFVHELQTGQTTRVSQDFEGGESDGGSYCPSFSEDGRYIAFDSDATDLVSGDTNGSADIFVRDLQTGQTSRASVDSTGQQSDGGSFGSFAPALSGDGRYVAFESDATNLVSGDTNGATDVFVHDLQTGLTKRVSVNNRGNQGNNMSTISAISDDGRYIGFCSWADNLVAGDSNETQDVFVHDRLTRQTGRVSVDSSGTQGNFKSEFAAISGDGKYVAFWSDATNLVSGDSNGHPDVFVRGPLGPIPRKLGVPLFLLLGN